MVLALTPFRDRLKQSTFLLLINRWTHKTTIFFQNQTLEILNRTHSFEHGLEREFRQDPCLKITPTKCFLGTQEVRLIYCPSRVSPRQVNHIAYNTETRHSR